MSATDTFGFIRHMAHRRFDGQPAESETPQDNESPKSGYDSASGRSNVLIKRPDGRPSDFILNAQNVLGLGGYKMFVEPLVVALMEVVAENANLRHLYKSAMHYQDGRLLPGETWDDRIDYLLGTISIPKQDV